MDFLKFFVVILVLACFSTAVSGQFSRTCRNLLKPECLHNVDLVSQLDNRCECNLHPVKAAPTGQTLSPFSSQPASPGIQCLRFSRTDVDVLFRCIAQPHALRSIDFYKESWSSLPDFSNFTNLQLLRLRDLALYDLDPRAFAGLSRLKVLELTSNKFRSLPTGLLDGVAGLEELILHGNRLAKIERSQFAAGGTKLKRLTLSEMEFHTIPNNFFDIFPELEFLSIRRTFLKHVGNLGTMRYLRALHLDNNRIGTIDANAFTGLYNLRTLDLRRNWLRGFPGELLLNQGQLENLWLGENVFVCDCRLSTLATWLRNSLNRPRIAVSVPGGEHRLENRNVSLDPNDLCQQSPRSKKALACGPKCENQLPAEYFIDVNEMDLTCTTTTSSTTTAASTPLAMITLWPTLSLSVSQVEANMPSDRFSPSNLVKDNKKSSSLIDMQQQFGMSTPFPLFAWDRFSLVLWLAIIAACSLVVVVVITIVVRVRKNRRPRSAVRLRTSSSAAKIAALAASASMVAASKHSKNDRNDSAAAPIIEGGGGRRIDDASSPDSSSSSSTRSSGVTATDMSHDASGASTAPLQAGNNNENNRKRKTPYSLCCVPRSSGNGVTKNRVGKIKKYAVSRESSGLSVAERAANKSGAFCKADWSPLFERAPSTYQANGNNSSIMTTSTLIIASNNSSSTNTTATGTSGSSGYGSPLLLSVDTPDDHHHPPPPAHVLPANKIVGGGTSKLTSTSNQLVAISNNVVDNSQNNRRRPISASYFAVEPLLLPSSQQHHFNGAQLKPSSMMQSNACQQQQTWQPQSSTLHRQFLASNTSSLVAKLNAATGGSATLNRSTLLGTTGAVLYPAYTTMSTSTNTNNTNNKQNSHHHQHPHQQQQQLNNGKAPLSSAVSTSSTSSSSPTKGSTNSNKSESLV